MIVRDGLLIQSGNVSDTAGIMRKRYDLKTEAKLALLPTVMMGIVLIVMIRFAHGQVFFTSLASSAFWYISIHAIPQIVCVPYFLRSLPRY